MKKASLISVCAIGVAGCAAEPAGTEHVGAAQAALVAPAAVLGFEDVTAWRTSQGTLSPSTRKTQGTQSLAVTARGYTELTSVKLSGLVGITSELAYDLLLPGAQPNPYWLGATQLYVDCPSQGVYQAYLGQVELTGQPLDQFVTLTYTLPPALVTKLGLGCADLSFKIVLNVPYNAAGQYLVDQLRFVGAPPPACDTDCGAHGQCDPETLTCTCSLGYAGAACDSCAPGFVSGGSGCQLPVDGTASVWPNAHSTSNSDAWLQVHHDEIIQVRPRVIAVNFVNPSTPAGVSALLDSIIAAFSEASRPQGFANPQAQPQLVHQLVKTVDLRDGVEGRPPPPDGYPYQNSTLYPYQGKRPLTGPGVSGSLDYAAFFSDAFAPHYGYADPNQPGGYLSLCELVEQGIVHEVWLVGAADVPDVNGAEVLETKPIYTSTGNRIPGASERCAGNGCFDTSVPWCGRSVRIGWVNYYRGPGCYVESLSHGLESAMNHRVAPALTEWFTRFGGFDLDRRYGLAFGDFYALQCELSDSVRYPTPTRMEASYFGTWYTVDPFDAVCGNVHFPPNGRQDYDLGNEDPVRTSCMGYGRHAGSGGADETALVSNTNWAPYAALAPDCMGAFLVWWWQNMPAGGSGQTFVDGRSMKSVWPFLYY